MIFIKAANGNGISASMGGRPWAQEIVVIADTEAEITALGEVVTAGGVSVRPLAGSVAYTPDLTVMYTLSPSGVWTKTV